MPDLSYSATIYGTPLLDADPWKGFVSQPVHSAFLTGSPVTAAWPRGEPAGSSGFHVLGDGVDIDASAAGAL